MTTQIRPQTADTEYVCAPWHLRLRWWLAALFWRWNRSFAAGEAEAPDLANPLWRR